MQVGSPLGWEKTKYGPLHTDVQLGFLLSWQKTPSLVLCTRTGLLPTSMLDSDLWIMLTYFGVEPGQAPGVVGLATVQLGTHPLSQPGKGTKNSPMHADRFFPCIKA